MIKFFKFVTILLFSSCLIAMKDDKKNLKHIENNSGSVNEEVHTELVKWYKESFITREDFAKIVKNNTVKDNTYILEDIADIIYDYVWLFNLKQINAQTFNFSISAFSKDGKYLAIDNTTSTPIFSADYSLAKSMGIVKTLAANWYHSIILKKLTGNSYENLASTDVFTTKSDLEQITNLVFSPNAKYIASISGDYENKKDYELRIWSIKNKNLSLKSKYLTDKVIQDFQFNSDESTFFFALSGGLIKLLNLNDNSFCDLLNYKEFENIHHNFKLSPDNKFLVSYNFNIVKIFDTDTKTIDSPGLVDIIDFTSSKVGEWWKIDSLYLCPNQEMLLLLTASLSSRNYESLLIKFNFITKDYKKISLIKSTHLGFWKIACNKKIILAANLPYYAHQSTNVQVHCVDDLSQSLPFNLTIDFLSFDSDIFLTDNGKLIVQKDKTIISYETSNFKDIVTSKVQSNFNRNVIRNIFIISLFAIVIYNLYHGLINN